MITVEDAGAALRHLPSAPLDEDVEWIVVATDGGSSVADSFHRSECVRILRRPSGGRAAAWNAGLMAARGEIVAFLDDPTHYFKVVALGPLATVGSTEWDALAIDGAQSAPKPSVTTWTQAHPDWLELTINLAGIKPLMLFSVRTLRSAGGFDSLLGPGTPARGGAMLNVLIRLLRAGHRVSMATALRDDAARRCAMTTTPGRQAYLAGVQLGAALGVGVLSPGVFFKTAPAFEAQETNAQSLRALQRFVGLAAGVISQIAARRPGATDSPGWPRVWCGVLDLGDQHVPDSPLLTADSIPYDSARFLVRTSGRTVGFVTVDTTAGLVSPAALARAVHEQLDVSPLAIETRPAAPNHEVPITVAVCTRNRSHVLAKCLDTLSSLKPGALEILVIDNAPTDELTAELCEAYAARDNRFRYVREPEPGLSYARNRALDEARNELLAFTDDDVVVDSNWLEALLKGFERSPQVGCVTGLVASASLETAAEQYFDQRVWWSSRFVPRVFKREPEPGDPGAYPFTTGTMGTGANFAVRRTAVRDIGGFDESLGAGAPAAGGEDIDIFARLLLADYAISYEPDAVAWHEHRFDDAAARRQLHGYGSGLAAYFLKYLIARPTRLMILRRLGASAAHALTLSRRARDAQTAARVPRGFAGAELRGLISGPRAYLSARGRQPVERRMAVQPR